MFMTNKNVFGPVSLSQKDFSVSFSSLNMLHSLLFLSEMQCGLLPIKHIKYQLYYLVLRFASWKFFTISNILFPE